MKGSTSARADIITSSRPLHISLIDQAVLNNCRALGCHSEVMVQASPGTAGGPSTAYIVNTRRMFVRILAVGQGARVDPKSIDPGPAAQSRTASLMTRMRSASHGSSAGGGPPAAPPWAAAAPAPCRPPSGAPPAAEAVAGWPAALRPGSASAAAATGIASPAPVSLAAGLAWASAPLA